MASERIGDMTKDELERLVNRMVAKRMSKWSKTKPDNRTPHERFQSIRRNCLKSKPGQPSVLEMLREDRER